jgi:hypothetical protein
MANEQNLIPLSQLPKEKQREIQKKGGQARAEKALRDKLVTLALNNLLGEECEFLGERMTNAVALAKSLVEEGKSGNVKAIAEIMDRTEGKPTQKIEADVNAKGVDVGVAALYDKIKSMKK